MRLIDADALKKRIFDLHFSNYGTAILAVLAAPTIDPIVKCKDCKHYLFDEWDGSYACTKIGKFVKRDFWCGYGERKANDA
jgi:hypothetical protein